MMSDLSLGDYVAEGAFASTNRPSEDERAIGPA
jgi:hypothetical protein